MTTHPYTVADLKTHRKAEPTTYAVDNNKNDNIRFRRGSDIVDKKNQIQELDKFQYKVKSQSTCRENEVLSTEEGWICSCADHKFRGVICKHLYAIFWVLNRGQVAESDVQSKHERKGAGRIMTIQISPNFSFSKEGMLVREFVTSDREVVPFFESIKEGSEVEKKFEQVLRIGVVALKSTSVAEKMDYVEKGFSHFDSRTKDRFTEFERKVEEVFGEHGIFSDALGENGKIIRELFDPSKIGTPMYVFKNEIMREIGGIREQLGINKEVEKLRQTTTLKGFDFQKYCENILNKIARMHADTLEYTGNKTGKITNCKVGD
jgi:SWIM zinc finger